MEQQTIMYSIDGLIKDWKESKHYFHKWIVKYCCASFMDYNTFMRFKIECMKLIEPQHLVDNAPQFLAAVEKYIGSAQGEAELCELRSTADELHITQWRVDNILCWNLLDFSEYLIRYIGFQDCENLDDNGLCKYDRHILTTLVELLNKGS